MRGVNDFLMNGNVGKNEWSMIVLYIDWKVNYRRYEFRQRMISQKGKEQP